LRAARKLTNSRTARQSRDTKLKIPNSRQGNEDGSWQKSLRAARKLTNSSTEKKLFSVTSAVSFLLGCSRAAPGYFAVAGSEGLRLADSLWGAG
jgi:hypothetical protein